MSDTIFNWPVRVYYEDTDAGGVVFYANYLKFFERARTEWLRSLGIEQDGLLAEGVAFVVRSVQMENLSSAKFNDQLSVSAEISEQKRASLIFKQAIVDQSNRLIATAEIKVVCVDLNRAKPIAIPKQVAGVLPRVH
ncbi:tol-pal system-associated acyl-CoA thioesterase [Corallincola luteus]|uniref:Tol-pal system-associated acyl-CoA thioesterase n=1 Tax=Corallincola luteus TaxID=1775177 RepID=A0ABY2AGB9_9GAMM|nr:tol-pal system-associated acyl-CoA thioesterase [Corallincola luteus]TCI01512.1 tol-pal system-associated acyl-CoA thioesterase [Corallincola luteus]